MALIAIIAILLVAIAAIMIPNLNKQSTELDFKSKSTITEGDSIKIKLTDSNGNPLANQKVNITVTDKDKTSDYHSVVTNEKGIAKLKLDKNPGKYEITCNYGGDDKYNPCNLTKNVKIEEKAAETQQPSVYAYKSDGTPMYSQAEVDNYMLNKYGMVNYHVGSNGYIDMDEPGYDDAGNPLWYY